jgi:hypothetical protein
VASVFQKKAMKLSFMYVLDIFKKVVGFMRGQNSYDYQLELKLFHLMFKFFEDSGCESILVKLA